MNPLHYIFSYPSSQEKEGFSPLLSINVYLSFPANSDLLGDIGLGLKPVGGEGMREGG
jgi:hypothetical protein